MRPIKIILDIKDDKIVASTFGGIFTATVHDIDTYNAIATLAFAKDIEVFTSSSLDFPTEYTTNPDTIALANAIRGNDVNPNDKSSNDDWLASGKGGV